jgi:hypothetical protein
VSETELQFNYMNREDGLIFVHLVFPAQHYACIFRFPTLPWWTPGSANEAYGFFVYLITFTLLFCYCPFHQYLISLFLLTLFYHYITFSSMPERHPWLINSIIQHLISVPFSDVQWVPLPLPALMDYHCLMPSATHIHCTYITHTLPQGYSPWTAWPCRWRHHGSFESLGQLTQWQCLTPKDLNLHMQCFMQSKANT